MNNKIDIQELINTLQVLEKYICFIFDNDKNFIKEFCKGNVFELINVSFTSQTCKIVYCFDCGQHVCDTIDTYKIIDWMDSLK
jgi:hypothetical protein